MVYQLFALIVFTAAFTLALCMVDLLGRWMTEWRA